jgi:hypothetical protein
VYANAVLAFSNLHLSFVRLSARADSFSVATFREELFREIKPQLTKMSESVALFELFLCKEAQLVLRSSPEDELRFGGEIRTIEESVQYAERNAELFRDRMKELLSVARKELGVDAIDKGRRGIAPS